MFGIDDAILGSVAGSVVGGLFGGDSQGGSQTVSKAPWEVVAPWLTQNVKTGQDLQNFYQQNPFNPYQQQAYGQLFGQNNYLQNAIPGLLPQLSQPMGYNPGNPSARPAPIQFPAMGLLAQPGGMNGAASGGSMGGAPGGLLGDLNVTANPFRNGAIPAPVVTPAPTPAPVTGNYIMYGGAKIPVGYDREAFGGT